MHIIGIGEGYSEGLRNFEKYFNGREYANGKCKVRVREVKLYHFSFNECGYDEVIADLKSVGRWGDDPNAQADTTTELHNKIHNKLKWLRRIFPMIKSVDKDFEKIPMGSFKDDMGKQGIWFNMALRPIGMVKDYRCAETGRELV